MKKRKVAARPAKKIFKKKRASMAQELPKAFLDHVNKIDAKRARPVIQHIIKYGQVTTEELKDQYGYNHPPRAARDVREQGVLLKTIKVRSTDGRSIGAYIFDPSFAISSKGGRTAISKAFKELLVSEQGTRCAVCNAPLEERYLQVDHRIPFEIAGDDSEEDRVTEDYMLLCGSCNRAKSWSCENCPNWAIKNPETCETCYWAHPEEYAHISTRSIRRLDVVWSEGETKDHDRIHAAAEKLGQSFADFVKATLRNSVK